MTVFGALNIVHPGMIVLRKVSQVNGLDLIEEIVGRTSLSICFRPVVEARVWFAKVASCFFVRNNDEPRARLKTATRIST